MEYKRFLCVKAVALSLLLVVIFSVTSCRIKKHQPDYNGIDEFVAYITSNSDVEIQYWYTDLINKDYQTANIAIYIGEQVPLSEIDSVRVAANDFLNNNPDYFLNDYCICITVKNRIDKPGFAYARFANIERITIPALSEGGYPKYDSLCAVEAFVSEEDLDYLAGLDDIVSLRIHPFNLNDETFMLECLSTVRSMNGLNDVYVADEWYDCFNDSDIECIVHSWLWTE